MSLEFCSLATLWCAPTEQMPKQVSEIECNCEKILTMPTVCWLVSVSFGGSLSVVQIENSKFHLRQRNCVFPRNRKNREKLNRLLQETNVVNKWKFSKMKKKPHKISQSIKKKTK